ncbi:MAG: hypothetical protein K8T10_06430 [Candidatus Eremiobacteraeota bacterium]|nr:hypothetical protein [Candidatus Eremiobacteraeota bacterium]
MNKQINKAVRAEGIAEKTKTVFKKVLREFRPFHSLFSIVLYAIFALIYTFPLILNMNTVVVGNKYGEMWSHLWGFEWVKTQYFATGTFPLQTTYLNYPYGGSLFFIDPIGALFSIPLQMVMSVQAAYNTLILLNLVFGAYAAYLLANYILKSRASAFYSGVVFSFSSFILSYISTGTSEIFNIGWIPLFIYFFMRSLFENSYKYAFYCGVSLFMTVFVNFYYAMFSALFASFIFFYFLYERLKKNDLVGGNTLKINYHFSRILYSIKKRIKGFILSKRKPRISLTVQSEQNSSLNVKKSHKSGHIHKTRELLSGFIDRFYKSTEEIHIKTRKLIPVVLFIICLVGLFILYLLLPTASFSLILPLGVISSFMLVAGFAFTLMELKYKRKSEADGGFKEKISTIAGFAIQSAPALLAILSFINILCLIRFYPYMSGYYSANFLFINFAISFLLLAGLWTYLVYIQSNLHNNADRIIKTKAYKESEKTIGRLKVFAGEITRKTIPLMIFIGLIALIFVLPYLYVFNASLKAHDSIILRTSLKSVLPKQLMNEILMGDNSTPLLDYVQIGKRNLLRRYYAHFYNLITSSSYIGILTLFFCLYAFIRGRRQRFFWLWAVCGFLFLILSMGPFFSITREINMKKPFFLYMFFYYFFPFFHRITIPTRLTLCTLLSLGILSGFGIKYLTRGLSNIGRNISVIIFSLFALIEIMLLSPAPFPVELCKLDVPPFYRQIAEDKEFYGIIESPIKKFKGGLYYQLIHKKGIILSVSDTTPKILQKNLFLLYLYNIEGGLPAPPDVFSEKRLRKSFHELQKLRVKYIVVHNTYLGNRAEVVNTYLHYFAGEPIISGQGVFIYRIY